MLADNLVEVAISDISFTNVGFALFLKPRDSRSTRVVPIFIGPLETYSISSALDGVMPPRPNTHDFIINMIRELEAQILHIVINDIIGSIFYARVVIQTGDGIIELDARPSDSVAIAIRSQCPIYMHEKVYQASSVIISVEERPTIEGKLEELQKELQQAVEEENFERAAQIRDKIRDVSQEN